MPMISTRRPSRSRSRNARRTPKGQTCYICMEAVHSRTGEGLVRGCACQTTEGFVHVSCLVEQAKILVAEAEENNLDDKVDERFRRWHTCGLCEQKYHGVVRCALGWACWKTYLGRPEAFNLRPMAMNLLGSGLYDAADYAGALSVREAELSTMRRFRVPAEHMLVAQGNLANVYSVLGRREPALDLRREVHSERLKLNGEEHKITLSEARNYALSLLELLRFEEAKALLRKTIPVALRVLGKSDAITLKIRGSYADALYTDPGATLDDLREAVTTLEETTRTARRVFGICTRSWWTLRPRCDSRVQPSTTSKRVKNTSPLTRPPPPPPPRPAGAPSSRAAGRAFASRTRRSLNESSVTRCTA